MKIALAQINPKLGDFAFNANKMLAATKEAAVNGASLVVFSEMSLFGYPAYDLLEQPDEFEKQKEELQNFIQNLPPKITVIFGAVIKNPTKTGKPYQNAAVIAMKGMKPIFSAKQLLPSYDIFDDTRFFEPGDKTLVIRLPNIGKVAITVCEDMWAKEENHKKDPLKTVKGVDLIVNLSASPYEPAKLQNRLKVAASHAKKIKAPFIYVNQVGGQDEIIFDGQSFVLDKNGKPVIFLKAFEDDLEFIDLKSAKPTKVASVIEAEEIKSALVLGIRDFIQKTGQSKVHLGLSGGIDSSLVACLAVNALGANRVVGLLLPGPFSSDHSITDAEKLAKNLGIETKKISINDYYQLGLTTLNSLKPERSDSLPEQNLQARLRALVLMMYSNTHLSMLLSTANKSELASGYSTIYGDTCGGLLPLGDLTKKQVYEISKLYPAIPEGVFSKAPSAELAPDQKDQDSLPPYDELDEAVNNLITKSQKPQSKTEFWLRKKIEASEFKRWQSAPILRVSAHSFGRGRRIPLAKRN